MYDKVRVVSTEVVENDWNLETDRALQISQLVSGFDEESRYCVVVTNFRFFKSFS